MTDFDAATASPMQRIATDKLRRGPIRNAFACWWQTNGLSHLPCQQPRHVVSALQMQRNRHTSPTHSNFSAPYYVMDTTVIHALASDGETEFLSLGRTRGLKFWVLRRFQRSLIGGGGNHLHDLGLEEFVVDPDPDPNPTPLQATLTLYLQPCLNPLRCSCHRAGPTCHLLR